MKTENLSDSFIKSIIKNEKGLNLATDFADLSIKNILDSPLSDLPIVKYIIGITKFGISVRDSFLIKKILMFLNETQKLEEEKKTQFINKIENDEKFRKQVGEHLILIIDRFDHLTKAEYLAKVFNAYLVERITYQDFLLLSSSIERAYINDLINLHIYYSRNLEEVDNYILQNLYQGGLVSLLFSRITSIEVNKSDIQAATYVRNDLGLLFCKIISNYPQDVKLVVPSLSDSENKVFEYICQKESLSEPYYKFEDFRKELKQSLSLTNENLNFMVSKFTNLNLLENAKQYADGNYRDFYLSFYGYNFYFNKLNDRNKFLKRVIDSLIEDLLQESSSFSEENNLSQRMVDHSLLVLQKKGLISTQEHSSGILINQINKTELEKFLKNLEE